MSRVEQIRAELESNNEMLRVISELITEKLLTHKNMSNSLIEAQGNFISLYANKAAILESQLFMHLDNENTSKVVGIGEELNKNRKNNIIAR